MKDKRQKMTLTWPCGDPILAAYVLQQAAAATGMQLGPAGPSSAGYPGGLFAAAAAAAAAAASSPFGPMMAPRPPGPPPPPPAFGSGISASSNMPHRPTPNLFTSHLHTPHLTQHPHYFSSGGGLSPRSPPIEGGGPAGSAFSPATPPASCDSSSNANVGQISPQTTTKIDHPQLASMKNESSIDLVGGERKSIESHKDKIRSIEEGSDQDASEEKAQSINCIKRFSRMKRKRGSSSGNSSSSSPPHSPPRYNIGLSLTNRKQSRNISSSSSSRMPPRKVNSPSSVEVLDGLYMVKSQENNKNTIIGKDIELSVEEMKCHVDDNSVTSKTKKAQNLLKGDADDCISRGTLDADIEDEQITLHTKNLNKLGTRSVRPITPTGGNVPSSASVAASLFQPYLDIEKK